MKLERLDSQLIKSFYEELNEELLNFSLPMDTLIATYDFVESYFINGNIAGICGLREGTNLFLIVRSPYQNRGLAQILLQKVITKARKSNYHYIQLTVFKTNEAAIHIYEKCGFKKVASIKVDEKDSYYMIKTLSFKGHFIIFFKKIEYIIIFFFLNKIRKKKG